MHNKQTIKQILFPDIVYFGKRLFYIDKSLIMTTFSMTRVVFVDSNKSRIVDYIIYFLKLTMLGLFC